MISKQQAKFVKSLKLKKYRKKASSFLVEGAKNVIELIASDFEIEYLFITEKFGTQYSNEQYQHLNYTICSEKELVSMGTFKTNESVIAVAKMKEKQLNLQNVSVTIALDEVSDPGNLGTIIRIADWYGVSTILASKGTADVYNLKVINASMGSFCRVNVSYLDLNDFLTKNETHKVYGAFLKGENVRKTIFEFPAILLMGNESKGIGSSYLKCIDVPITIPRFGKAESLNVAISTAIICDNIFNS